MSNFAQISCLPGDSIVRASGRAGGRASPAAVLTPVGEKPRVTVIRPPPSVVRRLRNVTKVRALGHRPVGLRRAGAWRERYGRWMNDKIGELIARSRYWSERAAHHTDRGAALRCAARADL